MGLSVACGTGSDQAFRTADRRVVRLAQLDGEAAGPAFSPPEALRTWAGDGLAQWETHREPLAVRFVSPKLEDVPETIGPLVVRVRPGGAREITVRPHLGGLSALHRVTIPLVTDTAGNDVVEVRVDLPKVIASAWEIEPRLQSLEILLPRANLQTASLEQVVIEGAEAEFSANAGRRALAIDGVIHPGWYVRGGSRVQFRLTLPAGRPELHQWTGAHGKPAQWAVRVRGDQQPTTHAGTADAAAWRHGVLELHELAGRQVTVELACEADGICLFGDPGIVDASPRAQPTDVFVYMIDTLRADRLGVFGNSTPDVSPVMDRLARDGVAFSFAFSTSSWTKPAIVALMTGIQPTTHRIGTRTYTEQVPGSVALVQERFRDAGWRTGSFVANPLGSTLSGLERGFGTAVTPQHWDDAPEQRVKPTATQLHDVTLAWIDEAPDEPVFAYVHTLDVHEWFDGELTPQQAYDRAVQLQDRQLGDFLQALADRGRLERALVVVVSDHGESLGEHGANGHGNALLQSQIHIPLIFWAGPRLRARAVDTPVGLADLPVTLLDLFGLPPLPEAQGRSLRAHVEGTIVSDAVDERPIPSELLRHVFRIVGPVQHSLVTPAYRKVVSTDGAIRRYDLRADPQEDAPVAEAWPEIEAGLQSYLADQDRRAAEYARQHGILVPAAIEADNAGRLRALGYLE